MKPNFQKLAVNGSYNETLSPFTHSHCSSSTLLSLLKACSKLQCIPKAQQIHALLTKSGFDAKTRTVTALILTYASLQLFDDALKVFEGIPQRTLPSYNAVISGFSHASDVLPACWNVMQGLEFHAFVIKMGYESDVYVSTSLLTMYSKCDEIRSAQRVFLLMHSKNLVSYNAMISGFLRNGLVVMALDVFRNMILSSRERPNSSSLVSILSACSDLSVLKIGKQVHCHLIKCEVNTGVMIQTALVEVYSKCRRLEFAYRIFEAMEERNMVTWNTMISGLLLNGQLDAAVKLFFQLRSEGLRPDMVTWNLMISGFSHSGNEAEAFNFFKRMQMERVQYLSSNILTSLLQACSNSPNLLYGKQIHCHAIRTRATKEDECLLTALIHMYMSCGCSILGQRVFDRIGRKPNEAGLWNAMISGYGMNGENNQALEVFRMMQEQRVKLTSATFLSALLACAHTGQVDKGCEIFQMMTESYGVKPTPEVYGCVVDLLSRAGRLLEAWQVIQSMHEHRSSPYFSLLGACKNYSNAELGEKVAAKLSELEPWNPTPLVALASVYAVKGRWNEVEKLRKMVNDLGMSKIPGFSWIESIGVS
ncbi:putative tetratricopeptide-like helical domain superfamily [Dioscorea sansibarensis]